MTKIDDAIDKLRNKRIFGLDHRVKDDIAPAIKKVIVEELDKLKADLIFKTNKYGYDFCVTLFNEHIERVKKELCGEGF